MKKPGEEFRLLPKFLVSSGSAVLGAAAGGLSRLGVTPNALTLAGLLAGLGAGILMWRGRPLWSLGAGLVSGACDILDGRAAFLAGKKSDFGAFLDSTLDRYGEFFLYAGAAAWLRDSWGHGLAGLAFLGSVMVSYTRARAEGLGIACRAGMMQRAERMVVLGLAIVVGVAAGRLRASLLIALGLIALFANATAVQRIFFVRRAAAARGRSGETSP
jgi:CDP-diacylglycerol--glycerol-3-phosphate 3-phosphatidyltransferase